MPRHRTALLATLGAAALLATATHASPAAVPRTWRSSDGSGSFVGNYLRHDARRVTIRRRDGRVFTLELARLHPDDRAWLDRLGGATTPKGPVAPDDTAVFYDLKLGDLHADVRSKLEANEALELTIPATFLARFGLNGSYRTRQQIGGQHCLLYFDWSSDGQDASRLRELSLQTEPADAAAYPGRLRTTWEEFAKLLATLHGPPLQAAGYPQPTDLTADGMFLASHLWRLGNGHSALLGTARDAGRFSVVVRFTTDSIEPVAVPAPAPAHNP